MDMRVKFLKSGPFNASRVTGGPYITGVAGEEQIIDSAAAAILHERDVVKILGVVEKAENRETKSDDDKPISRMNLDELRQLATEKGVAVTDDMTKAEIKAALDATEEPGAGGEG